MTQRIRSRNYAFTDFNMTLDYKSLYETCPKKIRYITYGEEKCPDTGRTHFQGWVQFDKAQDFKPVCKLFPGVHIERCHKDEKVNDKYCHKDGSWVSFGEFKTQGQRSDLEGIVEQMRNGEVTLQEVALTQPGIYCRYRNGLKDIDEFISEEKANEWRNVEVIVLAGNTGTGKTRKAMEEATYKINGSELQWWDGYAGDDVICIDEYDTDVPISKMLNILDGYKLRLPVKGGFTYARWTKVYITSNVPFSDWHIHAKPEHRKALARRVNDIQWLSTPLYPT